jgi:hypothetical protein
MAESLTLSLALAATTISAFNLAFISIIFTSFV